MSSDDLTKMDEAVLHFFKNSKLGTDQHGKFVTLDYLQVHFGEKRMADVKKSITRLVEQDLVEENEDDEELFKLTPFGEMHSLNKSDVNVFTNISNSNIANKSPGVQQSIKISELSEDIQENIRELEVATRKADSTAMKKAFGYIADKAVDVAVAIIAGALIK